MEFLQLSKSQVAQLLPTSTSLAAQKAPHQGRALVRAALRLALSLQNRGLKLAWEVSLKLRQLVVSLTELID